MAGLGIPAILAIVGTAAQVAGTATSAIASLKAGKAQQEAANIEAAQLEEFGKEEYASGQRESMEIGRQTKLLESRGRAVAAASGAGGSGLDTLAADVAQAGNYRRDIALYVGYQRRRGLFSQADVTRKAGRAALTASRMTAAGTLLEGVGSAAYNAYDYFGTYGTERPDQGVDPGYQGHYT